MSPVSHVLWIPAGALVGFLASFLFGDLITLPVDLYYFIYFAIVLGFFTFYVRVTELDLRGWLPSLVTANPVASLLSHMFLHVTAVIHSPQTELFLPPHRE